MRYGTALEKDEVILYACVLMSNHFHLFVGGDEYIARVGRYIHLNPAETEAMKRKSLPRRKAHLNGFRCGRDLAEAGGQRADGKDSEHRTEAGKAAEATAPKG